MVDEVDLGREFFRFLEQQDDRVARRVAAEGCPRCDGPLHRGDYDRKPRGALIAQAGEEFVRRFSLCCGREGCRKRATPPSLRFLGRRVYLGAVVLVASMLAQVHGTEGSVGQVSGVPARTTKRWLGWWHGPFLSTAVFVAVQARLVGIDTKALPASMVAKLRGTWQQRVRVVLEFLAPLTTGSLPAGSPFLRFTA